MIVHWCGMLLSTCPAYHLTMTSWHYTLISCILNISLYIYIYIHIYIYIYTCIHIYICPAPAIRVAHEQSIHGLSLSNPTWAWSNMRTMGLPWPSLTLYCPHLSKRHRDIRAHRQLRIGRCTTLPVASVMAAATTSLRTKILNFRGFD